MKKSGFTLIEVLIVISILAILTMSILFSVSRQRARAEDTRIKAYLNRLKIAFEDYYGDHNCYPPTDWFDGSEDCGSNSFSPYLTPIQCNRKTGLPYTYETDSDTCHQWFKLYATFSLPEADEQAIAQRSATGSDKGNYGVSSTNVVVSVLYQESSSPTPTPIASIIPGATYYYCIANNNCTDRPDNLSCNTDAAWVNDPNCGGNCVPSICTPN